LGELTQVFLAMKVFQGRDISFLFKITITPKASQCDRAIGIQHRQMRFNVYKAYKYF